MQKRRKAAAALVVLAVSVAAACTSGASKATPSRRTTQSGRVTGVTADTIELGFSYPDLAALAATGIIKIDVGPYADLMKAIVDDVNDHGGIHGRRLELFTEKYLPVDATAQLAVCSKLTEDRKVFAVLGGLIGDNNLCITQQHATILISTYAMSLNDAILRKIRAPWATPNASDERSARALVELLDRQGRLAGRKIAVYSLIPYAKPLVDLTVDSIKRAGYKVADTAVNPIGTEDTQALTAQDKIIAQRFKDEGIDVVFLSGTVLGADYDAIGWHPAIYMTNTSLINAAAYTNPLGKFPFVAAPDAMSDPDAGFNTPAMRHCRAVYERATGIRIATAAEEQASGKSTGSSGMLQVCTALEIFVEAAKAAGKNLTQQSWLEGLESLGTISLPLAPVASFGPKKTDGQDLFQLVKHDPAWTSTSSKPEFIPQGDAITLTK